MPRHTEAFYMIVGVLSTATLNFMTTGDGVF